MCAVLVKRRSFSSPTHNREPYDTPTPHERARDNREAHKHVSSSMDAPPKRCTRDARCPRTAGHTGRCKLKGQCIPVLTPAAAARFAGTSEEPTTPMTAREAQAQAQVEGLTLARADSRGGFRNVSLLPATAPPPALAVTAERTATGPPAASETSLPDAAPEAGSDCWAEAEVTAEELVKYHPRSTDLVGADVCIMAAAYPKYTLTCSGAVGWRGAITHTRGRGSDKCRVRVLGSWFRLADKTLIRPIKQIKAKAAAKAEAQAGATNATVRQAEAEGLTLQKSNNAAGYRGVYYQKGPMGGPPSRNPFLAGVQRDGKKVHLGCFATAEEAALAVARTPEVRARLSKQNGGVQLGGEQLAGAAAEATATQEEEKQTEEVEEGEDDEMELTRAAQGAAKGTAAKGAAKGAA